MRRWDELSEEEIEELEEIMSEGVAVLDCGCRVEPDGVCRHGNRSPLLILGLI
jgi:hypothetical protein